MFKEKARNFRGRRGKKISYILRADWDTLCSSQETDPRLYF